MENCRWILTVDVPFPHKNQQLRVLQSRRVILLSAKQTTTESKQKLLLLCDQLVEGTAGLKLSFYAPIVFNMSTNISIWPPVYVLARCGRSFKTRLPYKLLLALLW